ncbi:MAG: T9SS type A sorting domain-containing protein [Bacillota bacterium]
MNQFTIFLFAFLTLQSYAQQKTLLIFDLQNHTVDSVKNIQYDSTKLYDRTNYYLGTIDTLTEVLEQIPPEYNLYPNSQFTRKRRASVDYDISKYPIRTSVKISFERNDTLSSDCSGSMVSRRHVLTAAHCVSWMNTDTLMFDSLYVCPIFDNGQNSVNFPCSWVQKIFLFKNWSLSGEDFAILQLEESIGDLTGWLSIGFNDTDSSLLNGIYYKFSYPARTMFPIDSAEYNGDTLYYNYGKIDIVTNNQIGINHTHGIQGESGSSLIKVENHQSYTSYGVLSFSNNLMHCKINNWKYYYLESILHNDLIFGITEENYDAEISIFPNPAKDKIWVKNNGRSEIIGISVRDILGNILLHKNPPFSSIDLSALPTGIYFVQFILKNSHVTKKLIINGS